MSRRAPSLSPARHKGPRTGHHGTKFVDAAGVIEAVQGVKDEADPTRLMRCESALKWDHRRSGTRIDIAQGNSFEVGSQSAPMGTIFMSISDALSEGCSIFWRDPTWMLIHTHCAACQRSS